MPPGGTLRRPRLIVAAVPALLAVVAACGADGSDDAAERTTTVPTHPAEEDPSVTTVPEEVAAPGPVDDESEDDAPELEVVDIGVAQPGTWPVGGAGTVTFDVVDGALVLEGHEAADGWEAVVEEEDDDELELRFRGAGAEWDFVAELRRRRELTVTLRLEVAGAEPGRYELPQAGSFTFSRAGDGLALDDVRVAEGWDLRRERDGGDEIELRLRAGDRRAGERRVDVEVELDDGRIELAAASIVAGRLDDSG